MGTPATAVQVAVDDVGNYLHLIAEQKHGRLKGHQAFVQKTNGLVEPAKQAYTSLRGKLQHTYSAVMKGPASLFLSKLKSNGYSANLGQVLKGAGGNSIQKGAGAVTTVASLGIMSFETLKLYQLWKDYSMDGIMEQEAMVKLALDIASGRGIQGDADYYMNGPDRDGDVEADAECCGCFECFS